jgi:uncharacterized protein YyaL (SSP411 family)
VAVSEKRRPNRLANEKSPYLLEHAFNPVDWHAWGDEAFREAKDGDKPIFLSIGYSTCHWCHVMARESFEDPKTAAILNEGFVPIKVDREERPDLDEVYMKAVTTLTGQGGWPLSVFLTPDLKPFYGGTYFPPVQRHGLPSFPEVLNFISEAWKTKRQDVLKSSEEITKAISDGYALKGEGTLSKVLLDNAYAVVLSAHDSQFGGFGRPPKFPLPSYLGFLLRYNARTGKGSALSPVIKTLDAMDDGGIHDHLAGGFHRYSTDRYWLVPHFEKMLYDNAQLIDLLAMVWQETKSPLYAGRIAEEGQTEEVIATPQHPYTQLLLSAVPDPREPISVSSSPNSPPSPACGLTPDTAMRGATTPRRRSAPSAERIACSTRSRVMSSSARRRLTCSVTWTMRVSSKQIIR